jgi:hypothetical protein
MPYLHLRYKVRSEIARKQQFAYSKNSTTMTNKSSNNDVSPESNGDQEEKWRIAYEIAMHENELLKARNNDSILVNQWRERYELCLKEKESLLDKLKVYNRLSEGVTNKTIEQCYIELRDEYKVICLFSYFCYIVIFYHVKRNIEDE